MRGNFTYHFFSECLEVFYLVLGYKSQVYFKSKYVSSLYKISLDLSILWICCHLSTKTSFSPSKKFSCPFFGRKRTPPFFLTSYVAFCFWRNSCWLSWWGANDDPFKVSSSSSEINHEQDCVYQEECPWTIEKSRMINCLFSEKARFKRMISVYWIKTVKASDS